MNLNNENLFAYALAAVMLFVGVIGYAAFPEKVPDEPNRILFQCMAGKVQFSHQEHTVDYGLSCSDCHHEITAEKTVPDACGSCHLSDSKKPVKRSDAFHNQCIGCHEGGGPTECKGCHLM